MRSSSPGKESVDQQPSTVIPYNHTIIQLGKRTRDPSTRAKAFQSNKKQKTYPPDTQILHSQFDGNSNSPAPELDSPEAAAQQAESSRGLDALQKPGDLKATTNALNKGDNTRLQDESPAPLVTKNDKRILRSQQNSTRTKSELSWYFPDYDDYINDEPKDPGKSLTCWLTPFSSDASSCFDRRYSHTRC